MDNTVNPISQQALDYMGEIKHVEVLQSGAGYYIGTLHEGMPNTRDSVEYYPTRELAAAALKNRTFTPRLHP